MAADKLPPPTAFEIHAMRRELLSDDSRRQLAVLEHVWRYGDAAAPLVPDIASLLTSEDYVPVTGRKYSFSGHAPIAQSACSTLESIGIAPDRETLNSLLADRRIFELPEATYDQGAYIGDYGTDYIAPAAFGARLCELLRGQMAPMVKPLGWNTLAESELISWPARRAVQRFADLLTGAESDADGRLAVHALATVLEARPDVAQPTTRRGLDLRELTVHIRKRLSALS